MKKLLIALTGAACLFTQLPAKADQLQDIEKRGTIRIAVPDHPTAREKTLFEQLARESTFHPRPR